MEKKGDTKVNLKKSQKQLENRQAKTLLKKKKKVIRIGLIITLILFIIVTLIIINSDEPFSNYNSLFDYLFKMICLFLNLL